MKRAAFLPCFSRAHPDLYIERISAVIRRCEIVDESCFCKCCCPDRALTTKYIHKDALRDLADLNRRKAVLEAQVKRRQQQQYGEAVRICTDSLAAWKKSKAIFKVSGWCDLLEERVQSLLKLERFQDARMDLSKIAELWKKMRIGPIRRAAEENPDANDLRDALEAYEKVYEILKRRRDVVRLAAFPILEVLKECEEIVALREEIWEMKKKELELFHKDENRTHASISKMNDLHVELLQLGKSLEEMNRFEDAVATYRRIIEDQDEQHFAFDTYLSACTPCVEILVDRLRRPRDALAIIKSAQDVNWNPRPSELVSLVEKIPVQIELIRTDIHEFAASGQYQKALELFSVLLAEEAFIDYFLYGKCCFRAKQMGKAVSAFSEVIRSDPDSHPLAYYFRADAKLHCNSAGSNYTTREVIDDYSDAIRIDPSLVNAFIHRGLMKVHQKDFDSAALDFSDAVDLAQNPAETLRPRYLWALAWEMGGLPSAAIEQYTILVDDLRKGIKVQPQPKDQEGHIINARLEDELTLAEILKKRALQWKKANEDQKAIDDLNECVSEKPSCVEFLGIRGKMFEFMALLDRAISDFRKALELDRSNAGKWTEEVERCRRKVREKLAAERKAKAEEMRRKHEERRRGSSVVLPPPSSASSAPTQSPLNVSMFNTNDPSSLNKPCSSAHQQPFPLPCETAQISRDYLVRALGISDGWFDHQHSVCYCSECRRRGGTDPSKKTVCFSGRNATFPRGWVKMAAGVFRGLTEEMEVFKKWHVGYHGTRPTNLKAIVSGGPEGILRPGLVTPEGHELAIPSGHIDYRQISRTEAPDLRAKMKNFCRSRFVTPSLKYASVYAQSDLFEGREFKIVLQVRVRPESFSDQLPSPPFQLGQRHTLRQFSDPLFPAGCFEWFTPREHVILITGILVKIV